MEKKCQKELVKVLICGCSHDNDSMGVTPL